MELKKVWESDFEKAYELFKAFPQNEMGFENTAYGMDKDAFKTYLEKKKNDSQGIHLQEGYVPDTQFVLINSAGDYVGIFNLRHELNDFLRNGPGHVGYAIRKSMRNRGYATEGVKALFPEAKKLGIQEIFLSCNKDNAASQRVIEKCGGIFRKETETLKLYKIALHK